VTEECTKVSKKGFLSPLLSALSPLPFPQSSMPDLTASLKRRFASKMAGCSAAINMPSSKGGREERRRDQHEAVHLSSSPQNSAAAHAGRLKLRTCLQVSIYHMYAKIQKDRERMAAFLEGPLGRRKTPLDSRKMRRQTTIERGGLLLWPLYLCQPAGVSPRCGVTRSASRFNHSWNQLSLDPRRGSITHPTDLP
jgi:hypothetical protein